MALDLDIWTAETVSRELGGRPDLAGATLRQALDIYTREKLLASFEYAKENSRFYRDKFADVELSDSETGEVPEEWENIPFSTPEQLYRYEADSGMRFTEEDRRRAVNFFDHGMRLIATSSDTVLIIMPTESDDSIGKAIAEALERIEAKTVEYGAAFKANQADRILQIIREEGVTSVVATPTHMVALARAAAKQAAAGHDEIYLGSILLTGEYVPDKTVMMLEETFQAMIFEHYGTAEMGFECSISCGYGKGSHVGETDIYIELINPITGEVVRGESPKTPGYSNYGEIVFTTLNRRGMPFIRYRTGDYSRWILEPCPCGSQLKRLDKVYPGEEEKQNNGR